MTKLGSRALVVLALVLAAAPAADAATRHYWIAAVPTEWNVVPNGRDALTGRTFTREQTTMQTVVYKRFTRGWGEPLRGGIPGPLVRARVGDTVLVHFRNDDTLFDRPHSMHFHGFRYANEFDGSFLPGFSGPGANVQPGESFTYRLTARRSSRGVWLYHDHSSSMEHSIAGGLYGAVSILGKRERLPNREFVVFFAEHLGFQTVNGRAFVGNTTVFRARIGELVQWDVLAIGNAHHTFHLHGHRWRAPDGTFIDTRTVGPAESFRFRIREDVRGAWLYHCHVESHQTQGMIGLYRVRRR